MNANYSQPASLRALTAGPGGRRQTALAALGHALLLGVCGLLALPVLGVLASWLWADAASAAALRHLADTVLPAYVGQSLLLAAGVGVGVVVVGTATAATVALFDFPGRRVFEWALLLPLAMPAYVLAYAWTDALQTGGELQTALRAALGRRGPLWGEVRSLPAAVVLFVVCLYPYVHLLVRAALGERALRLLEAARMLGAPLRRRVLAVALPMARPALAAGAALALMETLADYGVGSYFGLATFTTGIYKTWLVMGDRTGALQLSALLLAVVALLLTVERRAQRRLRFATTGAAAAVRGGAEAQPVRLHGAAAAAAVALCAAPVLLGFALPAAWLVRLAVREAVHGETGLPLARFAGWALASLQLAAVAAVAATALALALAFAVRRGTAAGAARGRPVRDAPARTLALAARVLALGYAVPGAVIAVGMLGPVAALQARWPGSPVAGWVTGTLAGVVLAYLVRFSAVALQSVEAGYARLPPSLDDSARLLGAGAGRLFGAVHLPMLRRSVLAAALLVFVDVMKELPATLLLRPFGSDTLAVVAHQLARDERLAEAALPSLAIVAVGLLPVVGLVRVMRDGEGEGGRRRFLRRAGAPPVG